MKETVLPRASHVRAVKLKAAIRECEWKHLGDCKGRLDVAHVDGDEMNNEPENLKKLCRCHHFLLDKGKAGKIDAENPKMPVFYVDAGGKRRYGKMRKRLTMLPERIVALLEKNPGRIFSAAEVVPKVKGSMQMVGLTLARMARSGPGGDRIRKVARGRYASKETE